MKTRTLNIRVDALARVEGEGGIALRMKNGKILEHQFRIFEPPRFFEAFLRGRSYAEVPDITARICGICPVAYQMSSVLALEGALGVTVSEPVRLLRRLIYCGEWIESHGLHVLFLHAPDFLGLEDAFGIARLEPEIFRKGLELKKTGNAIVSLLGGREVHPVNMRVGGFYRMPPRKELAPLGEKLKQARDHALDLVGWVSRFSFPDFSRSYEFVSLRHSTEYPMGEGVVASSLGLNLTADQVERVIVEEQAPHSHALHARIQGRPGYLVGPLARFNLNFDRLSPLAREAAHGAGVAAPCTNPFQSIIVRAVEILQACEDALSVVDRYEPAVEPQVSSISPRAGRGSACTEAPRGLLYHRYDLDEAGLVVASRIMPPTSQNQKSIESDLLHLVEANASLDEERLTWLCEQAVRNYDPCISCATHSVRFNLKCGPDVARQRTQGIGILSGGLDSLLAVKVLQEQGLDLLGVVFTTPFFGLKSGTRLDQVLGIPVRIIDLTEKHLAMLRNPVYGFGQHMNPCIDCHALMLREAGRIMEEEGADFLFTGEVLGQRPMSQRRDSLRSVEKLAGYPGRVLRPLSARLLEPTIAELEGLVDRSRLLAISGRGRKRQMALAEHYGIRDYPQPGGGCLLTKGGFARKLRLLFECYPEAGRHEVEILKWGRHFRISPSAFLILGRDLKDNEKLESLAGSHDTLLRGVDYPGPTGLILGSRSTAEDLELAAQIVAAYGDSPPGSVSPVVWSRASQTGRVLALHSERERFRELMIT